VDKIDMNLRTYSSYETMDGERGQASGKKNYRIRQIRPHKNEGIWLALEWCGRRPWGGGQSHVRWLSGRAQGRQRRRVDPARRVDPDRREGRGAQRFEGGQLGPWLRSGARASGPGD
jgi:hypothetical protein